MKRRAIVSVATGHYVVGLDRLANQFTGENMILFRDQLPAGSPSHAEKPYAFKAHALAKAAERYTSLLWCDSCIVPGQTSLKRLWDKIERDGVWISNNGWTNAEWTADSAYPYLGVTREENEKIPHVVATAFGLDLTSRLGAAVFEQYLALAATPAFCGPWWNSNYPEYARRDGAEPCGDSRVRGHRHDQTALSVICARLGVSLTNPPEWFAYRGGEIPETALIADGAY